MTVPEIQFRGAGVSIPQSEVVANKTARDAKYCAPGNGAISLAHKEPLVMTKARGSQSPQGFQTNSLTDTTATAPSPDAAVLGGTSSPLTGAMVLGGHGKYLALLFDWFNAEAKLRLHLYYLLEVSPSPSIELIGWLPRAPLDDLRVKVCSEFAGYLKHKGSLFLPCEASYDPARCEKELRGIAYQALFQKARELGGVR